MTIPESRLKVDMFSSASFLRKPWRGHWLLYLASFLILAGQHARSAEFIPLASFTGI